MGARRIAVSFVPFERANPYQRELARELDALGIHVTPTGSLDALVGAIRRRHDRTDIVHLHWLPRFKPGVLGLRRALGFCLRVVLLRMLGRRFVWTVHNLYSHDAASRRGERWMTRLIVACASKIIVHSESARRLVLREFTHTDADKIAVVNHGHYVRSYENTVSAAEARARLQIDPAAIVILFLGNIRPYKGVPELVEAYQRLNAPASVLLIAGRSLHDPTVSAIEQKIAGDPRIAFRLGYVPDDDVQLYMNACNVVAFPYHDILTSGAIVLAMSFGRPCVAPAIGSIPDVLDRDGAFLYDVNDRNGLSEAMKAAIRDRHRLPEMGAHNLRRAREWGWDTVARQTAEVYGQALAAPVSVRADFRKPA